MSNCKANTCSSYLVTCRSADLWDTHLSFDQKRIMSIAEPEISLMHVGSCHNSSSSSEIPPSALNSAKSIEEDVSSANHTTDEHKHLRRTFSRRRSERSTDTSSNYYSRLTYAAICCNQPVQLCCDPLTAFRRQPSLPLLAPSSPSPVPRHPSS